MPSYSLPFVALCLGPVASAQVLEYPGPSPNIPWRAIAFDWPTFYLGAVAPDRLAPYGITRVELVGSGWNPGGAHSIDGTGFGLGANNGALAVVGSISWPADGAAPGDGWEFVLAAPTDEFQFSFNGPLGFPYEVELLLGGTSLGSGTFLYTAPRGTRYVRATGSAFDEVRVTFPGAMPPVTIDNLSLGSGPPPAPPLNDECATRAAVSQGWRPFSTYVATASPEPWACAAPSGGDVWFEYTGVTNGWDLELDVCSALFDTALEVYATTCAPGALLACNDDACGTRSRLRVPAVIAGASYIIRVGGDVSPHQSGALRVRESPPAANVPHLCVETYFLSDAGVAPGGVAYFDLHVLEEVSLAGLDLNTASTAALGVALYARPGGYAGHTASAAGWSLVAEDDWAAVGLGADRRSHVEFATPWIAPIGVWGIAVVGANQGSGETADLRYSHGTGANERFDSVSGMLSYRAGAVSDAPWSGAHPGVAVWNGRLCGGLVGSGSNSCAALTNSSGRVAVMSSSGSHMVIDNDLTLHATDTSRNAFGYFITSVTPGFFPYAGGSSGNLCLGGAIGRYVGPGQIQNSGSLGAASLRVDLTRHPSPTGLGAVQAGDTWYFSYWFRQSDAGGVASSNFTDRLEVRFQ